MRLLLIFLISISGAYGQTQAAPMPLPTPQFVDGNGKPLVGAKLCSYQAGTSTPMSTYADAGANTPNPNPIIINSLGYPSNSSGGTGAIFQKQVAMKYVLLNGGDGTCSTGAVLWSNDNVFAIFQQVSSLNSLIGTVTLAGTANQVIVTPSGNTLTFTLPQSIAPTSNVTFGTINGTSVNMATGPLTIGGTYSVVDISENINGNSYSINGTGIVDDTLNALFNSLSIIGLSTPAVDNVANFAGHSLTIDGSLAIDNAKNAALHNLSISGTCTGCPAGPVSSQAAGAHSLGVPYQNMGTTPKFIMVSVTLSANSTVVAYTDSFNPPLTVVAAAATPPSVPSLTQSFSFWCLPSNWYLVKTTGTVGLGSWVEQQ